jgi:hypothetical protein
MGCVMGMNEMQIKISIDCNLIHVECSFLTANGEEKWEYLLKIFDHRIPVMLLPAFR